MFMQSSPTWSTIEAIVLLCICSLPGVWAGGLQDDPGQQAREERPRVWQSSVPGAQGHLHGARHVQTPCQHHHDAVLQWHWEESQLEIHFHLHIKASFSKCSFVEQTFFLFQLKEAVSRVPPHHIGEPLMKKALGPVHMVNCHNMAFTSVRQTRWNHRLMHHFPLRRKSRQSTKHWSMSMKSEGKCYWSVWMWRCSRLVGRTEPR